MDPSSTPLADYFWIAGVDSLSYGQYLTVNPNTGEKTTNGGLAVPQESTIDEDKALETEEHGRDLAEGLPNGSSRRDSYHRLSDLALEARKSIQSVSSVGNSGTQSNRSSITIKALQLNGSEPTEFDFDKALFKFASERDDFLDELSFSAGTMIPKREPTKSKLQRVKNEEASGLRRGGGSIRRHISFRDLNSMRRQPSMKRTSSVRTSKRLSNYNSVIPTPQPISYSSTMHPLKRKFEPVLLDRYPPREMSDEDNRRGAFPDYVPMFAFPNDVNIVSADEQPRSTWHGFAMTSGDNSRIYGICVTIWMPLNPRAAEVVERQCEEWRRNNMSNEERELANSLGERLAAERAKLSEHLAKLPTAPSGSAAREALEDQISVTEEKIGLMTDLLRPVRHGAASKIDGLTDGDTGLWTPRAYGVLGRDAGLTSFWKEWLRAVVVPMMNGSVLRVPPSSPKIGMWQPLERYVVNLCVEAPSPVSSKTQVEISIRELRLFARKEAINEIPGSRNTDLYALFRSLSNHNILSLFEFALCESRIILLSSHTAMLHLASRALSSLLYPMTWSCIFIPVLPARLLSAVEAPCPYIVGIERRYESIELPEDDFVLVDLDEDRIESTSPPTPLPRQQRRKLASILQLAAPHHNRYGVPVGPPAYAMETFPFNSFSTESPSIFTQNASPGTLAKLASLTSSSFGNTESASTAKPPIYNTFLYAKQSQTQSTERPQTSSTSKGGSPPSPRQSPNTSNFASSPLTPVSRNDSGFNLATTLREKRSGHFDSSSRRSSSFGFERSSNMRRPSIPFSLHSSSLSTSVSSTDNQSSYKYAPSSYAQSTIAASTIMPSMQFKPVRNSAYVNWVEGHCLQFNSSDDMSVCSVCDDKSEDGIYKCTGCPTYAHGSCAEQICQVCPAAFHSDQIQAAFVRCFASLFYTYRKHLQPAAGDQKKAGKIYSFNADGFLKSMPRENAEYMQALLQTQSFNEFIHDRETKNATDPSIALFDEIILAKRNRGKTSMFSRSRINFLEDSQNHMWRSAAALPPTSRFPGDYLQVTSRIPAKLDPSLMREPRVIQGVPRVANGKARRKPIPSMLGINTSVATA